MKKVNLRELYPDIYKTDVFIEVSSEVQEVFLTDKRAEAARQRQMYNYKAYYSLDCDNGIESVSAADARNAHGGKAASRTALFCGDGLTGEAGKEDLCSVLSGYDS